MPVAYDPNQDTLVSKAKSQSSTTDCPECGGGNYAMVSKTPTQSGLVEVWRCFDCGYPLTQSGSGATMPSSHGSATQSARQAHGSGYNPNTIIGKVE